MILCSFAIVAIVKVHFCNNLQTKTTTTMLYSCPKVQYRLSILIEYHVSFSIIIHSFSNYYAELRHLSNCVMTPNTVIKLSSASSPKSRPTMPSGAKRTAQPSILHARSLHSRHCCQPLPHLRHVPLKPAYPPPKSSHPIWHSTVTQNF